MNGEAVLDSEEEDSDYVQGIIPVGVVLISNINSKPT